MVPTGIRDIVFGEILHFFPNSRVREFHVSMLDAGLFRRRLRQQTVMREKKPAKVLDFVPFSFVEI